MVVRDLIDLGLLFRLMPLLLLLLKQHLSLM
jgi:hypothetical protein